MAKVFTEQDVFKLIDQEAKRLNLRVIVDLQLPLDLYFAYGSACMGMANPIDLTIHLFMDSLMGLVRKFDQYLQVLGPLGKLCAWYRRPEKVLRKQIKSFLIHEARHVEQYYYLKEKGIDAVEYMTKKNKSKYWLRRHEIDAYLVQCTGIRLPLKWVLGV